MSTLPTHMSDSRITSEMLEDIRWYIDSSVVNESKPSLVFNFMLAQHGINSYNKTNYVHDVEPLRNTNQFFTYVEDLFESIGKALDLVPVAPEPRMCFFYLPETDKKATCVAGIRVDFSRHDIDIHITANQHYRQRIVDHFNDTLPSAGHVTLRRFLINDHDTISRKTERVKLPTSVLSPELVYPELPTPQELWASFSQSESNIVVIQGRPGTGKSSYIRDLLHVRGWDDPVYLIDDVLVQKHPSFVNELRELNNGSIVIIEDADLLLEKRTNGNSVLSGILNATAGIISKDIKLVFTTNLPTLKNVDDALLRSGRTHRVLEFSELNYEQARMVRESVGKNPNDLPKEGVYSVADAINYEDVRKGLDSKGFGFI